MTNLIRTRVALTPGVKVADDPPPAPRPRKKDYAFVRRQRKVAEAEIVKVACLLVDVDRLRALR